MKTAEVAEESEGWFRLRTIPVTWSSDDEEGGRRGVPEDLRHKLKVIGRKGEGEGGREREGGWVGGERGGREGGRRGGRYAGGGTTSCHTDTDIFLCRGRRQRRKAATWTGMNHVKGVNDVLLVHTQTHTHTHTHTHTVKRMISILRRRSERDSLSREEERSGLIHGPGTEEKQKK